MISLSLSLWFIFAVRKMKAGGISCPVAFIRNFNVTLCALSPHVSFSPLTEMLLPWTHNAPTEYARCIGPVLHFSISSWSFIKYLETWSFFWILMVSFNLWIQNFVGITQDTFVWIHNKYVFQQTWCIIKCMRTVRLFSYYIIAQFKNSSLDRH